MPHALRVLQITPYYEGAWAYGGIPRAVTALSRALVDRGHAVTVCTTDAAGPRRRRPLGSGSDDSGGVEVRVYPNLSNRLAYRLQLFTPRGLGRDLARRAPRFDLAHLHGCHHLPGVVAARALGRAGVPWVLSPHGTAPLKARRRLAKRIFDLTLGRQVLPGAARLLAVSLVERRELVGLGVDEARIRVVANPVALDGLGPPVDGSSPAGRGGLRRRLGLGAAPLVLYLGQLVVGKGIDLLVRAFAATTAPACLVLAGSDQGVARPVARLARRLGVADRVRLVGLLEGTERLEALVDADLVAYPGQGEVFGLVPAEALLCGTPVVVAEGGGCAEVLAVAGGGGIVAAAGNPRALAAALAAILADPARWRARAAAAGEVIRRRYDPAAVAGEVEAVYREVIP